MARHSRNIEISDYFAETSSGGLRTVILINRKDYLVGLEMIDPALNEFYMLPRTGSLGVYEGINIQAVVDRVDKVEKDKKTGKPVSYTCWTLKNTDAFFTPKEKRNDKHTNRIRQSFITGGKLVDTVDDLYLVEKKSSISISTVAYKLAIAMEGNFEYGRYRITDLAEEAWRNDIERARKLYNFIKDSENGEVRESDLPKELRAKSTISQEVEGKILKSACLWFGIDPDIPLPKAKRGRRPKRNPRPYVSDDDLKAAIDEDSSEGEYIRLTLRGENILGEIIKEIDDIPKGTDLSALSLINLVEILGTFKEEGLEADADFLEAYLTANWPNWEDRIFVEDQTPVSDDPWDILGIKRDSTKAEVKTAYRKIMMSVHPDRSELPSYFSIKVNNAYKSIISEIQ